MADARPPELLEQLLSLMGSDADPVIAWPKVREAIVDNRATIGLGAVKPEAVREVAAELLGSLVQIMATSQGHPDRQHRVEALSWLTAAVRAAAAGRPGGPLH